MEGVWSHICAGSVVSDNAVLTSGNCGSKIFHNKNAQIKMGTQSLHSDQDDEFARIYDVNLVHRIFSHP